MMVRWRRWLLLVPAFLLACHGESQMEMNGGPGAQVPRTPVTNPANPARLNVALRASTAVASTGQPVQLELEVFNGGGSTAQGVSPTAPIQQGVGSLRFLQMPEPTAVELAPGESHLFVFQCDAATTGAVTLRLGAQGTDASTGTSVSSDLVEALVVIESAAQLTLAAPVVPSARLNVGQTFEVVARITNAGQAAALAVTPLPLMLVGTGSAELVSGPSPATAGLPGGASQGFTWTYRATGAGSLTFSASAHAKDSNTQEPVTGASSPSAEVVIDTPAALTVTLSVPAPLTSGQAFTATMVVRNSGSAVARAVVPSTPTVQTVSGTASANGTPAAATPADIPGGMSATFRFNYTAAGTGRFRLAASASGADGNSGEPLAAPQASSNEVEVLAPTQLSITALVAPATVQRGQTFNVSATVKNNGGVTATGVAPSPLRPRVTVTGSAAASTTSSPAPVDLAPGASTTFTWSFVESGSGAGSLTFAVGASGTDSSTGAVRTASEAQSSPVSVVAAAALTVESVAAPAAISRGQTFDVQVTVRNSGGTAAETVLPVLSFEVTGAAAGRVSTAPASAASLGAGARTTFTFRVTENGTDPGSLAVVAIAQGTDAMSRLGVASPAKAASPTAVQAPAELQVTSFALPGTLQRGQAFAVSLSVLNSGQAAATLVLPSPSPPTLLRTGGAGAATTSFPAALSLTGGERQTFTWLYTENGSGAGTLAFSAAVRGTDANSGAALSTAALTTNTSTVIAQCDTSLYAGVTLDEVAADFAAQVYPNMTRTVSGCTACHVAGAGRQFIVSPTASETFHAARAGGFLRDSPGTILDRLTTTEPLARMPQGFPAWTATEVQAVSVIVCKLKAYDAQAGTVLADEQFPPNLLEPYTGPAISTYDNPFINYPQLVGRVHQVFGTGWVVNGVDKLKANIGMFGGVDFVNSFVEARAATADFLSALDGLGADVCAQAVADRSRGPFLNLDVAAELVDVPGSTDRLFQAETMPTKTTGAASGVGWNIYANGYVGTPVEFPSDGTYTFTVRAYATQAGTEPANMELRLDSVRLQGFAVPNTAYQLFTFTTQVAAGSRQVSVAFTNDYREVGVADRNLIVDYLQISGPAGMGTGTQRETAAKASMATVYRRMLYRGASAAEQTEAYTLLKDLVGLGGTTASAWAGLCEVLVQHPDFLFTRPPSFETASGNDRKALMLVRLAQDLVARPPTQAELSAHLTGGQTFAQMADSYFATPAFKDYYFYKMRVRTESSGTVAGDEPARLWTYLMTQGLPFQQLLTGDYSISSTWAKAARPAEHGKTGLLTMRGFIEGKPGLPHYNYSARVMTDFMGTVFDIPQEVFDQRATSTASSTVDPNSLCYSCHQVLTPLAHQRLRWADDGTYRTTDEAGQALDDSDRGMVPAYPFKGRGMEAFATVAVRKESFVRRMVNAHAQLTLGRSLRHTEDERVLYKQLWDLNGTSSGNLQAILKAIVLSPQYWRQ